MKIDKSSFYSVLFMIVIFLQLYLSSFKANIFFQIAVLILYFFIEKAKISLGFFKVLVPIGCVFFIGFLGTLFNNYNSFNFLKDIFHFIKPILGLLIGYLLVSKINDFRLFANNIVIIGLISALIHFCLIVFFSRTETVSDIRELGKDNFLELFALFFLGFYKKFKGEDLFKSKFNFRLVFCILLLSCVLYFSRTMIVVSVILLFSIYGYTRLTTKSLKLIVFFLLFTITFYGYLATLKLDRNGNGFESFLYKVQIAPSEIVKTKIDRNNHAELWDHWRGYEAIRAFDLMDKNPSSYFYGCGYGSLVNLKFFAPLTADAKGAKFISELHNGFPYVLYKTGLLGLFFYLSFLFILYKRTYQVNNFENTFISSIGLMYLFTTLTITGIYNTRDIVIFILGALFYFDKIRSDVKTVAV